MTQAADRFQAISLVTLARSIMRVPRADLVGTWPRSAAVLGRQALEIALDQLWAAVAPGVEAASMRAQLLCLPEYVGADLAGRIRHTWHALSDACHHHAYELPPTATELNSWLDDIEALINEVNGPRSGGVAH